MSDPNAAECSARHGAHLTGYLYAASVYLRADAVSAVYPHADAVFIQM